MNKLIIFTAPSGAGKTTIVKHLLKVFPQLSFSISVTTREQRYGEINGMDYYFISTKEFKEKLKNNEILEWQEVYENQYYGTLKSEITRLNSLNKIALLDIDVKGAANIKEKMGDSILTVFVKPPSYEVLEERLINRKTEDEASLNKRLKRVREEMTYQNHFDKIVLNDNLDHAFQQAEAIVKDYISK